jgi:hypothetical protein
MTVIGWVDRVDGNRVSGWVHSYEHPSRSELVQVVINGVEVLRILARKERSDLREREFAFVQKGFEFSLADFTDGPANVVEFVHVETGTKIGSDHYMIFSASPERWSLASTQDRKLLRQVFADDRSYYKAPSDGTWNTEPDMAAVAKMATVLRSHSRYLSVLEVEPPTSSFSSYLASTGHIGRHGVLESSTTLRDWHSTLGHDFRTELFEAWATITGQWDIIFLPMLHERSGPSFVDILEQAEGLLNDGGQVIFDIRSDGNAPHPYLLTHENRLLRISDVQEASIEAREAGLQIVNTFDFAYINGRSETARTMLIAERLSTGRR